MVVKSEPPLADVPVECVNACCHKNVKSERNSGGSATLEKADPTTSAPKVVSRRKGRRSRSSSSDSDGEKHSKRSVIRLPRYDGISIPFLTFKAQFSNAAVYNQ